MSSHGAVFQTRFAPLLPTSHLLQIVGLTWETVPPMRSPPWHNGSAIFCRARVADWVVIETTCLEAALFAATSLGGFPVGETTSPNQGSRKEPEAEQSSSNLPDPVRTCMLHLPLLPPPAIDAAFPANRCPPKRNKCRSENLPKTSFGHVRTW